MRDLVFLFDADNTLFDNDRMERDLFSRLSGEFGAAAAARYRALYEGLRAKLGYADFLGALELFRLENLRDPRVPGLANWLLGYPFKKRLFPGALDVVRRARRWGTAVLLSDGDAVFQPHKVERSGLWRAFGGRVLIYIHKEKMLRDVERLYPARRYVLIDDKPRILRAVKKIWKRRVTAVFARQGHYADAAGTADVEADISVPRIAGLLKFRKADFAGTFHGARP